MELLINQRFASGVLFFTAASYFMATVNIWLSFLPKLEIIRKFNFPLILTGFVGNTILIILSLVQFTNMGIIVDPYRFVNIYEFLLAFAWFTMALNLVVIRRDQINICGVFLLPLISLIFIYILLVTSNSPAEVAGSSTLMDYSRLPMFRSNFLAGYAILLALSYSAFAISFGLGIMYLVKDYVNKTNPRGQLNQYLPALDPLDQISYRFISHGFPFYTLANLLGALWAYNAWGKFWSWQPKETWAFISWLAYIAYLHVRLLYGWRGNRSAWMAVMGFLAILFTFLGVDYFLPGQSILVR